MVGSKRRARLCTARVTGIAAQKAATLEHSLPGCPSRLMLSRPFGRSRFDVQRIKPQESFA